MEYFGLCDDAINTLEDVNSAICFLIEKETKALFNDDVVETKKRRQVRFRL